MQSLLIVEDEVNLAKTLGERLVDDGFQVDIAKNLEEARGHIGLNPYHAAILDVGLPDGSGFDLIGDLKSLQPDCSFLFLTAYADPESRVSGLESGAADFIAKPFHYQELLLRIKNAVRKDAAFQSEWQIGNAHVNLIKYQVIHEDKIEYLTQKECSLLRFLIQRASKVVSRDEILEFVWQGEEIATQRTVDNFIMRLRKLLRSDQVIQSIRGVGYSLKL